MDIRAAAGAKSRAGRTPSSERLLGIFNNPISQTDLGDELSEHDVFCTGNFSDTDQPSDSPPISSSPRIKPLLSAKSFGRTENFGILAALPLTDRLPDNIQPRSAFIHKPSSIKSTYSSPPLSNSRLIPKKPPLDRPNPVKYHQSAPVNVPMISEAMRRNRAMRQFDEIDDDDGGDDDKRGEAMLPPHEMIASRQSPMMTFSVLEGAGRTLKGRDLSQVRNAVLRKTGFLD